MIPISAGLLLLGGTGSLLWVCSEASRSLLYVLIYLIALVPGLPLGFALFGRRHAAGWISGCLLGYALTAVLWSVAIHLGARFWTGFFIALGLLLIVTVGTTRQIRHPLILLPRWSSRDTAALLLVLLLVPALMWLPYAHNGAADATGTRYYRAYFTADFLWHMALTGEMTRLSLPPTNPLFADQTMRYYWMYFMVPAVGASLLASGSLIVEQCLEINAVLSGLLFVSALFLATWAAVPRALAAATAVAFGMVAASFQGWYGIYDLYVRGRPLSGLRALNIDALTNWFFHGLRIDGLPRSLWWTPQHGTACALGLIALVAATAGPASMSILAILAVGVALGASLTFSPLLGGAFAIIYGVSVAIDAVRRSPASVVRILLRHALAAIPVAIALAWCAVNQMFEGAGSALAFGFGGLARHAPLQTLVLALGPLLLLALVGVLIPGFPPSAIPHALGAAIGVLLLYFVRLAPDEAWVGFRAGQILQIALSGLSAICIAWMLDSNRALKLAGIAFVTMLFAAGLPTTIINAYNAQDTANRAMGPGFRWTIDITRDQQAAFDWIARATPREAIVQMEPTVRGRETWSLLPSFAQRRMMAGTAVPFLIDRELARRTDLVKSLYATADADAAWDIAQRLRIDYVYLDRVERRHFAAGLAKFEASPHFMRVYRNAEVLIYAVRR